LQAEIRMPSAVSGRAAKLAIRVPGVLRPGPQSPTRSGLVGHGAQAVTCEVADHLVVRAVVDHLVAFTAAVDHLAVLAVDQEDTFPKVVVDDIDFLPKRIIDVPELNFSKKK
jgi:hypothetical protein